MVQTKRQKKMMLELKKRKSITQSVVFPKSKFTITQAKDWLRRHDLKRSKVDVKPNTLRFRQHDPKVCQKEHFFAKKIKQGDITLVMCRPKRT